MTRAAADVDTPGVSAGVFRHSGESAFAIGVQLCPSLCNGSNMRCVGKLVALGVVFTACLACDPEPAPSIPIPGDFALGTWPTYEALSTDATAVVDAKLAELTELGMSVRRIHTSWAELEEDPATLRRLIDDEHFSADTKIHVLLETVDSEGYVLPADLVDASVPYRLAEGRAFDDDVILERFDALVARIAADLDDRIIAMSLGNEPDNYFDDFAESTIEGNAWRDGLLGFLAHARGTVHAVREDLPVAYTLTQAGQAKAPEAWSLLVQAGDFAAFNLYCTGDDLQSKASGEVATEIEDLAAAAGDRQIVVQELGCPAGAEDSLLGATPAAQAAFFSDAIAAMHTHPQFRAAFVFQLIDWTPELADSIASLYTDAGYPELGAQVAETLTTLGLIDLDTLEPRPAWSVVRDEIAAGR